MLTVNAVWWLMCVNQQNQMKLVDLTKQIYIIIHHTDLKITVFRGLSATKKCELATKKHGSSGYHKL